MGPRVPVASGVEAGEQRRVGVGRLWKRTFCVRKVCSAPSRAPFAESAVGAEAGGEHTVPPHPPRPPPRPVCLASPIHTDHHHPPLTAPG